MIENIEVVEVALVEDQLKQHRFSRHVDRLQLSRLKSASFVRIKTEVADSLEFDFVQGNLVGHGLLAAGQEGEQFNLGRNLTLMRQEL